MHLFWFQVYRVPCVAEQVSDLTSQKAEIEKAIKSADDDSEKMRLRGMQQGVTSQLYCATGKAKVRFINRIHMSHYAVVIRYIAPIDAMVLRGYL